MHEGPYRFKALPDFGRGWARDAWFEQPGLAVGIVAAQLGIFGGAEVERQDYGRGVGCAGQGGMARRAVQRRVYFIGDKGYRFGSGRDFDWCAESVRLWFLDRRA